MTHPPIPKDHPRFSKEGKWTRFQTFDESDDPYDNPRLIEFVLIERLTGLQRQDAAAHAAAWWYEEYERRSDDYFVKDDKPHWELMNQARENIKAWLAWGAQK